MARFLSFWILPPLSFLLILFSVSRNPMNRMSELLWLVPIGVLLWTVLEYFFHRYLLHAAFRSPLLSRFINASHLQHHTAPRDPNKILVYPSFALVVSSIIYAILVGVTRNLFHASGIIIGIWAGFLYYESVHYRVHMSLAHSRILQRQRRAHFQHHFSNPNRSFGVTSPIWDYVFRTNR